MRTGIGSKAGLALCAAALCAGVLAGCGTTNSSTTAIVTSPVENAVTVTASSEVRTVPDKARIGVSVVAQGSTADEAQTLGSQQANAVLDALRAAGVADESIQTSYTDLSPQYDYSYDSTGAEIIGYEMRTRLQVSDLDVSAVGPVIQAAVAAGATGTDGVEYYSSDYDAAYAQALADAMAASRDKAQTLADAGGVRLGAVVNVQEGYQDTSARYAYADNGIVAESADEMAVAPGQLSIEANVTVSYAIE